MRFKPFFLIDHHFVSYPFPIGWRFFILIRSGSLLNSNNEERIILWDSGVEKELKPNIFLKCWRLKGILCKSYFHGQITKLWSLFLPNLATLSLNSHCICNENVSCQLGHEAMVNMKILQFPRQKNESFWKRSIKDVLLNVAICSLAKFYNRYLQELASGSGTLTLFRILRYNFVSTTKF